jgi:hypothetical protein
LQPGSFKFVEAAERAGKLDQSLRWNASHVQARTSESAFAALAIDQRHFASQLGGASCSYIAPWTAAKNQQINALGDFTDDH